ncbi:asparaginase, partial [Enterobacter hormaechei]|nr:asparaginase [Enterobacter hormaechei]
MPDLCERALKTVPSSREEGIFSFEEQELITMQKKSIYVAYTGGTIGMQRSENGYIPVSGHLQRQLAL